MTPGEVDQRVGVALCERYPAAAAGLRHYAQLLAGVGVERGLIGPREAPRLWSRHLANSAVVEELIPAGARLIDVGSGAGLPGLPLALVRPDLSVVLLEPLLRRASFLQEAVAELGLADRVQVRRARSEQVDPAGAEPADAVVARAVAPLERLAGWTLPLLTVGGTLLALKGAQVQSEIARAAAAVRAAGGTAPEVVRSGVGWLEPPTTVVRVSKARTAGPDHRCREHP